MKKLFFVFLVFFLIGSSFCYAFGFKVVESIEGEAYYNKKKSKKISEKVLPRNDEKKLKMIYDSIISNMVECPAGSFIMGSPENELGRATRREKQHKEIIAIPFYIGKYEVTQSLYETITGDNPSTFFQEKDDEDRPVENISWDDAVEFCEILNSVFKDFLPKGYRFDLPTQAQWEYACRAGTTTSLNNGKNIISEKDFCPNLDEVGWYIANSERNTHPVGKKEPNAWDIYDMHGNVWEWCKESGYIGKEEVKFLRGGAWESNPDICRSAYCCFFGSRAMCGKISDNELNIYKDEKGISFAQAMREYGLEPLKVSEAIRKPGSIKAFIELHIEQGPILENEKINIGIVESVAGLRIFDVFIHGRSDHAGNTPLTMRADSFLASAKAVCAGTEKALEIGENTVLTCGYIDVKPGAFNIVTNETHFQIDCRSRSLENVDKVLDEVRKSLDASCTQNLGLSYEIKEKISMKEVPMNENIKKLMEREADNAGISTRRMLSGAAHDAMVMGSICDVAMIFVPSHEGRSHVPEEWTDYKDIQKGTELLYRTVKNLASE